MKRILLRIRRRRGPRGAAVLAADAATASRRSACRPSRSPPTTRRRPRRSRSATSSSTTSASARPARWPARPATTRRRRSPTARCATSEGIKKAGKALTGTRNAPTVVNAAYFTSKFWDGRSPSLEDQSQHPFLNPVEMGLKDHQPILKIVRTDPAYVKAFEQVFGKKGAAGHDEGGHAGDRAPSSARKVSGDSPFDRYYFGGDAKALTDAQKRGFDLFVNKGRCVSCHGSSRTRPSSPTTASTTSASASTASRRTCRRSPGRS